MVPRPFAPMVYAALRAKFELGIPVGPVSSNFPERVPAPSAKREPTKSFDDLSDVNEGGGRGGPKVK